MARISANDGVAILACTPHVRPPTYDNATANIQTAMADLQSRLHDEKIDLTLVIGADIHVNHFVLDRLQDKTAPTLHGSRYFLFEPPHHVLPPNIDRFCGKLMEAGYIPILTHPERLTWIENHYDVMTRLDEMGLAVQITAGSITGDFGKKAKYWSERFLAEGRVDIIASDAHDTKHRIPVLSKARDFICDFCDEETAKRLTLENPLRILKNEVLPDKKRVKFYESPKKAGIMSVFNRLKTAI